MSYWYDRRSKKGGGIIYLIELPDGKRYVGATTQPLSKRWRQHVWAARKAIRGFTGKVQPVDRAIAVAGIAKLSTLAVAKNASELSYWEYLYIRTFRTTEPDLGYNGTYGAFPYQEATKETRAKMSAGRFAYGERMRAIYGRGASPEDRAKIGIGARANGLKRRALLL